MGIWEWRRNNELTTRVPSSMGGGRLQALAPEPPKGVSGQAGDMG
jgi:hypothetical protein